MSTELKIPGRIAFIVPRYAKSIGGGAETLLRELACAIVAQSDSHVEVWTTCAMDHRTWENQAPAGEEFDGKIKVTRFPVDPRDLEVFIRSEHQIQGGEPFSAEKQLAWLSSSVNSEQLYLHIQENGPKFDVLIFAPYLFATSFWGSLIYPERSVIVPCLHDEEYAYLDVFKAQFSKVRGLLCNAEPERQLVHSICAEFVPESKTAVVGMGFEPVERYESSSFASIEVDGVEIRKPYLLYSGRKEVGKNVDFLINCFEELPESMCSLVLIGAGSLDFRESLPAGVVDLGFVSEDDKKKLMANSMALCQPSTNESFSIVMMEAWQQGTPCLVNGACPVTRHHVSVSNGGLYFENSLEFKGVLRYLLDHLEVAAEMGENGARYVATEYDWSAVLQRFSAAMFKFGILPETQTSEPTPVKKVNN